MDQRLHLGIIGTGLKASDYATEWMRRQDVEIIAAADIDPQAKARFEALCVGAGHAAPRLFEGTSDLVAAVGEDLDAVYVSTPHVCHVQDALQIVGSGIDLLLEKPMATSVEEARCLAESHAKSPAKVVISYQASMSPLMSETVRRARQGEFGELVSVSAAIWEDWSERYAGNWKQKPEISGGGFMFDTGAHMLNAVCLLAGYDFAHIAAFMAKRGKSVDIAGVVAARLADGTPISLHACGDSPTMCDSRLTFFFARTIVTVDAWGRWREIQQADGQIVRDEVPTVDPMDVFVDVLAGRAESPSTVQDGLRLALLWEAIKLSAYQDGRRVTLAEVSVDQP